MTHTCLLPDTTSKNRYYRRSKISAAKFRQVIRHFALDLTATDTAILCGLSVRSTNEIFQCIRKRIYEHCAQHSPFSGELEADESYFGPRRVRGKADAHSVIHINGWRGYDGLVDMGFEKHFRVNHGNNEFARGSRHVNGIESFWSFAKHRLAQFHVIPEYTFAFHLKEAEFRFNHRHDNLYPALLKLLRENPI